MKCYFLLLFLEQRVMMLPTWDKAKGGTFWFQEGQIKDLWSFIQAVDWTQTWLIILILAHVLCCIMIFFTRKHTNLQLFIFCIFCGVALSSQKINELAAKHWKLFANEQYFDSSGLFITLVMSGPIMLNCLLIVIMWLYEASQLLVKAKRRQFLKVETSSEKTEEVKSKQETKKDK